MSEKLVKRYDANSAVLTEQLKFIQQARTVRYRPAKARSILQVDRSVPAWVQNIVTTTITDFASLKPINMKTQDFPLADFEAATTTLNVGQFGSAFEVADLELERAERTGINAQSQRSNAIQTAAEQLVDQIAATGDPFGIGLPGLANNADVVSSYLTVASTKTAGGLTWGNGTQAEILGDLEKMVYAVAVNSKELFECDTIVLPQASYNLASGSQNKRSAYDQKSALQVFREQFPSIRVMVWDRLNTAGAGSTKRAVAFNASDPQVARLVMLQELTQGQPLRKHFGVEVAMSMITAGVIIENPNAVTYMDGI